MSESVFTYAATCTKILAKIKKYIKNRLRINFIVINCLLIHFVSNDYKNYHIAIAVMNSLVLARSLVVDG